jgi:hypothetical protein
MSLPLKFVVQLLYHAWSGMQLLPVIFHTCLSMYAMKGDPA